MFIFLILACLPSKRKEISLSRNQREHSPVHSQKLAGKQLAAVFPDCGKVFGKAASMLLDAMTDTGSPRVWILAEKLRDGYTSEKGGQEQVSSGKPDGRNRPS